jgi:hypothetical protein
MGDLPAEPTHGPRISWKAVPQAVPWAAVAVLLVAAGYETLQALGVLAIGPQPGQTPAGETTVLDVALLTLAGGGLALLVRASSRRSTMLPSQRSLQALSLSAVAFAVARWSSYDPYYAPTLRRMSDGGIIDRGWIVALVVLAAVAIWSVPRTRRGGVALTGAVLWLAGFIALFCSGGH